MYGLYGVSFNPAFSIIQRNSSYEPPGNQTCHISIIPTYLKQSTGLIDSLEIVHNCKVVHWLKLNIIIRG